MMDGQALSLARDQDLATPAAPETRVIESLRELTRTGYVADPDAPADGQGILLRHDKAPDLVLHADGRIELPRRAATATAAPKSRVPTSRKAEGDQRISWRRTFLVFFVAMIAWSMSVFLGVAVLSS
jgi:hypothetical protein